MEGNHSEVRKHYEKLAQKESAQCKHCPGQISCKGSNASGLARHLGRVLDICIDKKTIEKSINAEFVSNAERIRINIKFSEKTTTS
jgi:hypothetical protein